MAGFALLLRYLTWQQAALFGVVALAFNAFALRRLAPTIMRDSDQMGFRAGVLYYPLSILVLVLVLRDRLDIVAAAWGVMALGDGFATLVGTTVAGKHLPWNPQKTWSGLLAFMLAGGAGAVGLSFWVGRSMEPPPSLTFLVFAPLAAAVIAAFVETIPIELDDNISVPFAAGAVLWIASQFDGSQLEGNAVLGGILVSLPVALLAWRARVVTFSGAVVGFAIAVTIHSAAYLAGIAVLALALLATVLSSRAGHARKQAIGVEEPRGGQRGAANIIANCAVGTIGAVLAIFSSDWSSHLGSVVLVTGLAAGASDTVASEIGKAFGGTPRAFPTFRRVAPGTPGAVSIIGTLAGIVAATVIALPAFVMWLLGNEFLPIIVIACTIGAFVESALATQFESRGILNNDALNFINTATAASVAVAWAV